MNFILGIDYSLNSPAICVMDVDKPEPSNCRFYAFASTKKQEKIGGDLQVKSNIIIVNKKDEDGLLRYKRNLDLVNRAIEYTHAFTNVTADVYIEGYSFASASSSMSCIYENGGILRFYLWEEYGIESNDIPPTKIKKFATTRGTATKQQMYKAWIDAGGSDLMQYLSTKVQDSNPLSDIVDSYFIAKLGLSMRS